jgi:iron complex outermembrane receptor protein
MMLSFPQDILKIQASAVPSGNRVIFVDRRNIIAVALCSLQLWLLPVLGYSREYGDVFDMDLIQLMNQDVVTPSKITQKISDAPGTVIVVTRKQIRERGYVNLVDLLEDLPGVDVNHKSVEAWFNQISFHGITGNNKFIIMQDGVRISSPSGEIIPVSDNFPLFHAKQVEVVYGPASALYGADALTGVINIITQSPESVDGVEISSSMGTDDYFYNYLNFGKAISENIKMTFGGHWHKSENPDLSETWPDKYGPVNLIDFSGNVIIPAADREGFTAPTESYSVYGNLDLFEDFSLGFTQSFMEHPTTIGVKPENAIFSDDAVWQTKITTFHGKYDKDFTENLSGKSSVIYSYYELLPDSKFTNNFANFGSYKYGKGERLMLEQQLDYNLADKHDLTGGIVFQDFSVIPKTADLTSPYNTDKDYNDQGFSYQGTNGALPLQIFKINYQNYGLYTQVQSHWTDRLSSTIGFRFDHDTRFGDTVNPRCGLVLKPSDKTTLKIFYGEAFLAPSVNLAWAHFGSFDQDPPVNPGDPFVSSFFHIPNPDLQPERSRTVDVNLTHNVTPDLVFSGAAYYTEIEDLIATTITDEGSDFIPRGFIETVAINDNIGKATAYGLDMTLQHQFARGQFNFKSWASYSWVNGKVEGSNNITGPLPITARNKIKAGVTMTYAKKYFITPKLLWVDKTSHFHTIRRTKTPSYALLNLHAGANDIYKGLSAFVTVRNLADVKYYNAGGGSNSFANSPQDPRRIFVGLKYKF